MQEGLLVRRRSARLQQRAATAGVVHHHVAGVTAHDGDDGHVAGGSTQRRRRRTLSAPQQEQQEQQPLQGSAEDTGADAVVLQPLAPLTNQPAKRARGRPPAAAATKKAAAPAADADAAEAAVPAPAAAAAADGRKAAGKAAAAAGRGRPPKAAGRSSGSSSGSSSSGKGPTRDAEQRLWIQGFKAVAGVDEAGRGPLAGPVVAAAAVLPRGVEFAGLNDSKQMSEAEREDLYEQLTTHPDVAYAVAVVDHTVIDTINILQAAMLAMQQAVEGLADKGQAPDHLLIDGNRTPPGLAHMPLQLLVKGDATSTCIAAASVIAKVTRDRLMLQLDKQYPQYGFAQHKGYGVPAHKAAISQHGPCPIHRRSFEPVKTMTGWAGYPKRPVVGAAAGTGAAPVKQQQQRLL